MASISPPNPGVSSASSGTGYPLYHTPEGMKNKGSATIVFADIDYSE
jgi:hypothetical protein